MALMIVTGPIGAGKSTLVEFLRKRGAAVLRADDVVRELYATDPGLVSELEQVLQVALRDGSEQFAFGRLAAVIFNDPTALAKVEALVHPKVKQVVHEWLAAQTCGSCVYEVPRWPVGADRLGAELVVKVTAPDAVRRQRLLDRGMSAADAEARLRTQAEQPEGEVDLLVDNLGTPVELDRMAEQLLARLGKR